jgi:hypothetical protein
VQHLNALQQFYVERGFIVNVIKIKVMVLNSIDPCQEFMFEGDVIECV